MPCHGVVSHLSLSCALCLPSPLPCALCLPCLVPCPCPLLCPLPCALCPVLHTCSDSMSKDLYKALRCFLVEFQDLNTYTATNNFTAMHFLQAIPGKGEPRCVHMVDNTRLCQVRFVFQQDWIWGSGV